MGEVAASCETLDLENITGELVTSVRSYFQHSIHQWRSDCNEFHAMIATNL